MKNFVAILILLVGIAGQSVAQISQFPAPYQVRDLERADRLNVRNGPGVSYRDVGDLFPFTPITVVGFAGGGAWAEIEWEGGTGWVSSRFIEPLNVSDLSEIEIPQNITGSLLSASEVQCFGTEPFWSINIMDQTQITYATPDSEPVTTFVESIGVSANDPRVQMFSAIGFTGVVRPQICNDGASDTSYDWALDMLVNDGFNAQLYSGCCQIIAN